MPLKVDDKGTVVECAYRVDLVIDGLVIVELKAIEAFEPVHEAQLLTCLRLSGCWLGLLIIFNVPVFKDGIKRMVNG